MNYKESYTNHKESYQKSKLSIDSIQNPKRETIDYHRHYRMYNFVKPILISFPKSKWLTIGDGKYGQDSIRLKEIQPKISVLPTDISPYLLAQAKEAKLVENYSEENAEFLSFKDESFDFVFCKEAFHHFPRPYIGIYEMLRVAKKAIILIEPNDQIPYPTFGLFFTYIKNTIKKLLKRKLNHHDKWRFEDSGNYVYTLSKRELEKIALGLGLKYIAVLTFNDYYNPELSQKSIESKSFGVFKRKLKYSGVLNRFGFSKPTNIVGIIFKSIPNQTLQNRLKRIGFNVIKLPINLYG